jgi:DNA mismatch repair protein MutL
MTRPLTDKTAPIIRPLPARVINKIAAGEVVERPASVVKELVENAVDAGADRIDIIVEKSGTKLIKIVDNGCGIDEEQIEIAFSRHATSKIASFDDLNSLYSYGFRGEALPSIASVSRLRMVSRTHQAKAGTEIIYEGGVLHSKEPVAAPPGTIVEVENLFYNTPARRKFLKAETTEARHISRTATALAIGRYDIGFSLIMNGRKLFSFPSGSSLKERVAGLLGNDKEFIAVKGETGPVKVNGCIGMPDLLQNNRFGQFIFINDRFIHSPTLSHALAAGYGELIPRGMYPVGALLLTVDPTEVDVNVHPAKTEVRLSHEREIHDALSHIVKEALRQDGIIPSFKAAEPLKSSESSQSSGQPEPSLKKDSPNLIPGARQEQRFDPNLLSELYKTPDVQAARPEQEVMKVDKKTGEVLGVEREPSPAKPEPEVPEGFRLVGSFSDLYLLVQSGEDLYVVDQHTAHERVLYEETLPLIEAQGVNGQSLLFPVQVELTPEQLSIFDEALDLLNRSGFTVSHFGGRMVNIEAVPSILSKKPPDRTFLKVIDDIASLKQAGYDLKKAIAQSIACRSAVMAGDRLTDDEATHLVSRLLKCRDKYSCPHGRPTFIRISKIDLDKQFGRT